MEDILIQFNQLVKDLLEDEKKHSVAKYVDSKNLYQELDLSLKDEAIKDEEFNSALKELVCKTPRTATPGFFNQLFGGRNNKAILGELLAVILNNSMYTYKAAGPQIGVEKVISRKICDIIGWGENSDGTFAPGGSMTNFMSMLMARDAFNNRIKHEGMKQGLTVYTSSESHYSISKNAAFAGVGRENVRFIPTNKYGVMDSTLLHAQIVDDLKNGYHPIMVNATAGTTVLGAFDDFEIISEICKKHDIWLHIDGAYCGAVIFSDQYKYLLKGVENANSFSFNAHKMIGTPLSCSIIVVHDKKHLYDSFSNDASYLYQTDQDEFNLGKTSLQCGRRNDALKFWTLWKSVGTKGLESIVNTQFELADVARNYITNNPDYTLYSYNDSISICFNYKDIPARDICTILYENSKLLVGYGSKDDVEFIRLVTINAQNSSKEILDFFATIEFFVANNKQLF